MRFKRKKYFLEKKVFDEGEVLKFRNFLQTKNDYVNKTLYLEDENTFCNELKDFIFNQKILDILKKNLSSFVFVNEFIIQKNNRTFTNLKYHKDSGSFKQSDVLKNDKYLYGKVGLPLQDNIKNEGGGIDILKPLIFDNFSDRNVFRNKIRALYYKLQDLFFDTHFHSESGDMLYFEAVVSHRTSMTKSENLDNLKDKYVVYCQLTNFETIKKVLNLKKNFLSEEEIKKNIKKLNLNDREVNIMNKYLSQEVSSYMGLADNL